VNVTNWESAIYYLSTLHHEFALCFTDEVIIFEDENSQLYS